MTVPNSARRAGPYPGNGVVINFPFDFKVFEPTDVQVTYVDEDGNASVITTGYAVTLNPDQDSDPGGSIQYPVVGTPMTAAESITVLGDTPYDQESDITNAGRFLPQVIENALDKLTILSQQLLEIFGRTLTFPANDSGASATLPTAEERRGKFLAFDAGTGDPVASPGTVGGSAAVIGFQQAGPGAVQRTVQDELRDHVSAKQFGVVGDYVTDDSAAFETALAAAATLKKTLDIGGMNIRITRSIDLPRGIRIRGDGGASIQTWMQTGDKLLMRPGYKSGIAGSNIFLSGNATKTYTTNRVDGFSSFTYGLSYLFIEPMRMEGVGIILDCDVFDSGGSLTSAAADNRANYDVGLVLRSQLSTIHRSNFFGYWTKGASLVVHSQEDLETLDSDYNRAFDTNFTGIAVIGDEAAANGLTGFSGLGCGYYSAADHHTIADGNYLLPAIFIDGDNGIAGIRGHRFDGNLRTRSNVAVKIDRCDDVRFDFYVTEVPTVAGVPNADSPGVIVGTVRTNDVFVGYGGRSDASGLGINTLASTIGGRLVCIGGQSNGQLMVTRQGSTARLLNSTVNSSVLQLTSDPSSETSGWTILRNASSADALSLRYNNTERMALTTDGSMQIDGNFQGDGSVLSAIINRENTATPSIASGVVLLPINRGWSNVDTEASAALDDLDTISPASGSFTRGQVYYIKTSASTRDVVFKHGTGNIRCNGAADFTLATTGDHAQCVYDGANWRCTKFSA